MVQLERAKFWKKGPHDPGDVIAQPGPPGVWGKEAACGGRRGRVGSWAGIATGTTLTRAAAGSLDHKLEAEAAKRKRQDDGGGRIANTTLRAASLVLVNQQTRHIIISSRLHCLLLPTNTRGVRHHLRAIPWTPSQAARH